MSISRPFWGSRRVYNGSRETTAYVINVEGAREALKVCFPLSWQLDTMLTMHLEENSL